jgi:dTMP kinase
MTGTTGRYLALEGIEGAGKSSVAGTVAQRLEAHGVEVLRVREPGGTPTGERIRSLLLEPGGEVSPWTEAMLFAASRSQLAASVVAPALAAGTWVVSDRSVYSSLAYQGGGRRLGIDAVRTVNESGLGSVWPELVVLLRLDPEEGLRRQAVSDRIGGETVAFQRRVSEAFDTLAAAEPLRIVPVDATRPLRSVADEVWRVVEERWQTSSIR